MDSQAQTDERAAEFLTIFRQLWSGEPVTFTGKHLSVENATIIPADIFPDIYLGGSSPEALEVAAEHADVYLTWGEPPAQVAEKVAPALRRSSFAEAKVLAPVIV